MDDLQDDTMPAGDETEEEELDLDDDELGDDASGDAE